MYYLLKGGSENKRVQIICSKSNSITFYRSLGMRIQAETQKERSQGTSVQQNSKYYLPRAGSKNNRIQNICSKCNYIMFYRSLGMRNQEETQKERSQGTSIQQNSMLYLTRGGSENNRVRTNLLQIQFYHVL